MSKFNCNIYCCCVVYLITWLLTRRKYNTEVEHNSIENMEGSLEFYEKLTASNNKILSEVLEKSEKLLNLELVISSKFNSDSERRSR